MPPRGAREMPRRRRPPACYPRGIASARPAPLAAGNSARQVARPERHRTVTDEAVARSRPV